MKIILILLFSFFFFSSHAQTDSKPHAPAEEDSTWELTHYSDKKNGQSSLLTTENDGIEQQYYVSFTSSPT